MEISFMLSLVEAFIGFSAVSKIEVRGPHKTCLLRAI